jgi:hypothetical protein
MITRPMIASSRSQTIFPASLAAGSQEGICQTKLQPRPRSHSYGAAAAPQAARYRAARPVLLLLGCAPLWHLALRPPAMRSHAMTLSAVAALAAAASASSAGSSHGRPDGVAGWDTSGGGDCPCSDAKLCEPITKPRSQEDVCELCIETDLSLPAGARRPAPRLAPPPLLSLLLILFSLHPPPPRTWSA